MIMFQHTAAPQSSATMVNLNNNNTPTISNSFLILLFLQHLFLVHVTSYVPLEDFPISCGSSGESVATSDNRNWFGDIRSKLYSPIEQQNNQLSIAADASELPPDKVPYATARLSRSGFTYSFPVSDGPKLLRLYFFPASYFGFDRASSLFTVKSGQYTLVKDFNASLAVDNDDNPTQTASREYCINVEPNQRLNLTFTPSTSHPNAYAFINGIEIVSIPTDLYQINNGNAFETLYRINVGGGQISAMQDTGMFRHWVDDGQYLKDGDSATGSASFGLKPIYEDGRDNYTAPDQVYLTARTYGTNRTLRHNVTWEFPVDSGFAYKVRLHFCEFEQRVQHAGDRVFRIFIADKLVEPRADVIEWSGEVLFPVYKDYAVDTLSKGNLKKLNLSIKLQPNSVSKINDIILNGIEIFKVSDSSDNLGGSQPDPPASPPQSSSSIKHAKSSKNSLVFAVAGASAFIVLLLVIFFIIYRWRRRQAAPAPVSNKNSSVPSDRCRNFALAEIKAATNNFDEVVGHGGFGDVYKGYIDKGAKPVAIKRLKPGSEQGAHEFQTEINVLSQLSHPHLVPLIGYCDDGDEMMLVYDYMARGTLRDHLQSAADHVLPWKQRLEICLGAAKGLHYLHAGAKQCIIHRDVKTTNILLDDNWVAKVSDFGLSRLGPTGISRSHTSTGVKGSYGYLDPEYCMSFRLTQKSDVYSFGVVLLEILCGRPPLLDTVEKQQYSTLVAWVRQCHHMGEVDQTVDPDLKGTIKPRCLKKFIEMALSCLHEKGKQRPSMSDVVKRLELVLRLQESTEEDKGIIIEEERVSEERPPKLTKYMDDNDDDESSVQFTSTEASVTTDSKSSTKVMTVSSDEERALVNYGVL